MKKTRLLLTLTVMAAFVLAIFATGASANTTSDSSSGSKVSSISLTGNNSGALTWKASSVSSQGFKVVWSKNQTPVYPCREGDQYHYYGESTKTTDTVDAFNGDGTYYVRVCEYLGGRCGTYSNQIAVTLGEASAETPMLTSEKPEAISSVPPVTRIVLRVATNNSRTVEWSTAGVSSQGFKVVWSKNENPTYPTRDGDQYHYLASPTDHRDTLTPFAGMDRYFVRVCEYRDGACGVYSNQIHLVLNGNAEEVQNQDPVSTSSPTACTLEWAPICGTDGVTYGNKCQLTAAKATKKYIGECQAEVKTSVTKIELAGESNNVKWKADGNAVNGFKVVWSKNENPTYPTRDGDQYHYLSNPGVITDFITPFSGNGTYYVRVCEYLNGKCGVYSNQISVSLTNAEAKAVKQIEEIRTSASDLFNNNLTSLLAKVDELKNIIKEQQVKIDYLLSLKDGLSQSISSAMDTAINNFITYGVDANSKNLGEGERAAVMYSFKAAYDKLPETQSDLEDAIKIANGRWPSLVSNEAEAQAKAQFKKIYLREADMNDNNDAAAIKVMAYGLRQQAENRNLKSEAAALKTYKAIFKKLPSTTEEWNALQAITYSGATR